MRKKIDFGQMSRSRMVGLMRKREIRRETWVKQVLKARMSPPFLVFPVLSLFAQVQVNASRKREWEIRGWGKVGDEPR